LEDVEGLLQGGEVVGAEQDEGRPAVAGDQDAVMLALDPVGATSERWALTPEKGRISLIGQVPDLIGRSTTVT
jgi:hypothetical protein